MPSSSPINKAPSATPMAASIGKPVVLPGSGSHIGFSGTGAVVGESRWIEEVVVERVTYECEDICSVASDEVDGQAS